ncbi:hypothetical protein [Shewanella chilikensis]|uniref:hypothetical protein n=1 Tax=Shewanella chilikensis TaxID=558541 RepID=UPI00399C2E75
MFEDFDFSVLEDPYFKEDAVREELIVPIIKSLGYKISGSSRVIRSKPLVHPYVAIGSQQRKISIIPDYVFTSEEKPYWILDAKSPSEDIFKSKHVEQAYSYAIHPEIRAEYYALCNGIEFALYHVRQFEPVIQVSLKNISEKWDILYKLLNPDTKADPDIVNFKPDYGIFMLRAGMSDNFQFIGSAVHSNFIAKVEDGLYTTVSVIPGNVECAISLDFNELQLDSLAKLLPEHLANKLLAGLKRQPYYVLLENEEFKFGVSAFATNQIISNNNEQYLPFQVAEFLTYKNIES